MILRIQKIIHLKINKFRIMIHKLMIYKMINKSSHKMKMNNNQINN